MTRPAGSWLDALRANAATIVRIHGDWMAAEGSLTGRSSLRTGDPLLDTPEEGGSDTPASAQTTQVCADGR